MKNITCIEDLRQVARCKVPRAFFDYAEAGSYAEETLRANREDMERIKLRQRVLFDVSERDLSTTILGETVSLRPYVFGLGAGGQAGVARAIDIIRHELDVTMALTGTRSVTDINRQTHTEYTARSYPSRAPVCTI